MLVYVRPVQKGEVPADAAVGRKLAAALAHVPRAVGGRTDSYLKALQIAIQDALMVRDTCVVLLQFQRVLRSPPHWMGQ